MTDEHITAYLLEELTEQESERFEEQCFAQDEWPAQLDAAEHDLIDAYLQNELTSDRRRRFVEQYLTTDARKARVLAATTIHQVLCPQTFRKVTFREKLQAFWQRPLVPQAALAVLVIAIAIWLVAPFVNRAMRSQQSATVIGLELSSSYRDSGSPSKRVTLPLGTDVLEVHLTLPKQSPDTASYRIQWEDLNGVLGDLTTTKSGDDEYLVRIPAASLRPGTYVLKLFEVKRDGTEQRVNGGYFFTAEDKAATR